MINIKIALFFILLILPLTSSAQPIFLVKHQRSINNFAEIQLVNQTNQPLLCYIAIDGHKIKFTLPARLPSKWYRATDTRFNYKHFSPWCDYLSRHPKYQNKG